MAVRGCVFVHNVIAFKPGSFESLVDKFLIGIKQKNYFLTLIITAHFFGVEQKNPKSVSQIFVFFFCEKLFGLIIRNAEYHIYLAHLVETSACLKLSDHV